MVASPEAMPQDRPDSDDVVASPRLTVSGVGKSFGVVRALDDVSFDVPAGAIVAVVGENGAGKSTLMKLVAGVENPDQGDLFFDGASIRDIDEARARDLGIAMVHQERSLVGHLSVAENIYAGRQPTRFGLIDRRRMNRDAAAVLRRLGVDLAPDALVGAISPAAQQMVELAKALSQDTRLLILDEPTAALTVTETENLFTLMRELRSAGVAILYISHRLAEVFTIADRIVVLRDGRRTALTSPDKVTERELMTLMVGREIALDRVQRAADHRFGEVRLAIRDLAAPPRVSAASLEVRAGEIVCLAGLIGAGRSELCEAVFGLARGVDGSIELDGVPVSPRSPSSAMRLGIGMIPEDRKEAGLFLDRSIAENVAAADLRAVSIRGWISRRLMRTRAAEYVERLRVRTPGLDQPVELLSGGNQQKVLLAKWMAREPRVLIIDEPTRGVDVGARTEIYAVVRELAAAGTAVLVVSSDLSEVLGLADRIVVMAEGRTTGELDGSTATELAVLELAAPSAARRQEVDA